MSPTAAPQADNRVLAERLYDTLMAEIDPDLLLVNLPHLDEQYAAETPEEHDARMKRYEAAYAKFDIEFKKFMDNVHEEARVSRRTSLKEQEEQDRQSDQPVLASLEAALR